MGQVTLDLAERIEAYHKDGATILYNQQQNKLPALKKDHPWYKGVHSQVLQNVLRRLDNGYQSFFRRVNKGQTPGLPKFKKRGQCNSITFPQYHKCPTDCGICVSKVGNIKVVYHREIPEKLLAKSDTIFHENLAVENMIRRPKPKQDEETGQYLPNGASARGGLNKSIADAG